MPLSFQSLDLSIGPVAVAQQASTPAAVTPGSIASNDSLLIELNRIFLADAGQKRKNKRWNNTMATVAQNRALDMANRKYFGHKTPDGFFANKLVRDAGYPLAKWYPANDNQIESIAAGYVTAQETYTGWMNSPHHKTHLLGNLGFFAEQIDYAFGHATVATSPYVHYWVFLSARS